MTDDVFIRAIQENPNDGLALLAYADWLEERGDLRAEFVRLLHLAHDAPKRMKELSKSLDAKWLRKVTKAFDAMDSERIFVVGLTNEVIRVRAYVYLPGWTRHKFCDKRYNTVASFRNADVRWVHRDED
jgi:uncharacterized protein (TIGR02996 family)